MLLFGLFVVLRKYGVYFPQFLFSPFIAGENFYAPLSFGLVWFLLISTAEDPLLIVTEISFSSAAKPRWVIWVGELWEEPDKSECEVPSRSNSAALQCKATAARTLARYGVEVQKEQKMM